MKFYRETLLPTPQLVKQVHLRLRDVILYTHTLSLRAGVQQELLIKLQYPVNNQTYNIWLFIYINGPVTRKQLEQIFPATTLERALTQLEAADVIKKHSNHYHVKRINPKNGDNP